MMSRLDYSRLRSLTSSQIARALRRDGFELTRQSGSHQRYRHADGRRVTLAYHRPGQTYPLKTLKAMLEEQAEWDEADLRRLKLMK